VHRHIWPEQLLDALRRRSEPPCLRGWTLHLHDGHYAVEPDAYGPDRCLADLDRDGIDVAVVSCPPTLGLDRVPDEEAEVVLDAYHEGIREVLSATGGRLVALGMGRAAPDFVGASVSASSLLDLDAIAPLLDELERDRRVLFVHPGLASGRTSPAWWPAVVDYTAQMQAAYASWLADGIERWPDLRVLFAILAGGAPIQLERLRSRGFDVRRAFTPNVYLDTASYGRRALELCLATYGGSGLVFGSDGPVIDSRPGLEAVRGFGQAVVDALCRDNPRQLLGVDG
jgi:hypothetical protein